MKKHLSLIVTMSLALSACSQIPPQAYFQRGNPTSLLDASSEVVNVALTSEASVQEVVQWVDQDQPTSAQVYCLEGDAVCTQTLEALELFQVPVQYTSAADNMVALQYDRVVARDCEHRYIDNTVNPYNLNHPTLGCSTAVNMIQMVENKREFTNPVLLDYMDGEKAVQRYEQHISLPATEAEGIAVDWAQSTSQSE